MVKIKNLNKLDMLACFLVGQKNSINDAPEEKFLVLTYWTSCANVSVIFATIFSSMSIVLFIEIETNLVVIPFFIAFIWFSLRAWAFGRCAKIACKIWL